MSDEVLGSRLASGEGTKTLEAAFKLCPGELLLFRPPVGYCSPDAESPASRGFLSCHGAGLDCFLEGCSSFGFC
jgi:hypothetical protein